MEQGWFNHNGQFKITVIRVSGGKKINLFCWDDSAGTAGDWKPVIQVGSLAALAKYVNLGGLIQFEIPPYPPTEGQMVL